MAAFLMDYGANDGIRMVAGRSYRHRGGFVTTAATRPPATAAGWGRGSSSTAASDRNARKLTEAGIRTRSTMTAATTGGARLYFPPSDGNDDEKDDASNGGDQNDGNDDD